MSRNPADAHVAPPWRPDVTALDHYAAALADDVARHVARRQPGFAWVGAGDVRTARAYVAVCDAIDDAWVAYAKASRGAA